MKKCSSCGKENPPRANFCNNCGLDISAVMAAKPQRVKNGTGQVCKRGKTYTYIYEMPPTYDENGKVHRHRLQKSGFQTMAEAEKALAIVKEKYTIVSFTETSIGTLWTEYSASDEYLSLAKSTRVAYSIAYRRIKFLYNEDVRNLSGNFLQDKIGQLTQADGSPLSYNEFADIKDLLSNLFKRAKRKVPAGSQEISNVALQLKLPRNESTPAPAFSNDDIKTIWFDYFSGNMFSGFILLMIYSGMMPGELLICQIENIDLKSQTITENGLKNSFRKSLPILFPKKLLPVVKSLIGERKQGSFLNLSKKTFYKYFGETVKRLELNSSAVPYSCRRTTATLLESKKVELFIQKMIMRHTVRDITDSYKDPNGQIRELALKALDSTVKSPKI